MVRFLKILARNSIIMLLVLAFVNGIAVLGEFWGSTGHAWLVSIFGQNTVFVYIIFFALIILTVVETLPVGDEDY